MPSAAAPDPDPSPWPAGATVRHDVRPGDLGEIVRLHGAVYAREHGFDPTFEAYVAAPLADFVLSGGAGGRLWVAERDGRIVGSIAIVGTGADEAQLRWFLVDPSARGAGLGRRLLEVAVGWCAERGLARVFLWTVDLLVPAARLYQAVGFRRTEARPVRLWGRDLVEERYVLDLRGAG